MTNILLGHLLNKRAKYEENIICNASIVWWWSGKKSCEFDIFSGLMLERKEYRSLLQYRFNRGGQNFC